MDTGIKITAGVLGGLGVLIEAVYIVQEWGFRAFGVAFGAALIVAALGMVLLRRLIDLGRVVAYVASVLLSLALVGAPVAAAALVGGTLDDWIRIYLAGAAGGLVLELTASRGQVELPGPALPAAGEASDPRRPLLPQIDLGVLGRFLLGGLAAVVILMLGSAAGAEDSDAALVRTAAADLSVAWAIAIGSASAAVWQAIARMVQARVDTIAALVAGTDKALEHAERKALEVKERAQAPAQEPTLRTGGTLDEEGVRNVMADALQQNPTTVNMTTELPRFMLRLNEHVHSAEPVMSSETLVAVGQTLGAVAAAREHLSAIAAKSGITLP